jgi:hypothetical protein
MNELAFASGSDPQTAGNGRRPIRFRLSLDY